MTESQRRVVDYASGKIGCGYIFGATGWVCSPLRRQQQATQYPQYADKILGVGAKWDGKQCFDCAQLTRFAAQAGGATLPSGANSQWQKGDWLDKGTIDTLPDVPATLVYRMSGGSMQHTGVYIGGGEVVEARGTAEGVIRSKLASYKWTHWARLAAIQYGGAETTQDEEDGPMARTILYQATVKTQTGGGVGLWPAASTAGTRVALIPDGAVVEVLDELTGGWREVQQGQLYGYVNGVYLIKIETEAPPAEVTVPRAELERIYQDVGKIYQDVGALLGVHG